MERHCNSTSLCHGGFHIILRYSSGLYLPSFVLTLLLSKEVSEGGELADGTLGSPLKFCVWESDGPALQIVVGVIDALTACQPSAPTGGDVEYA